MVEGQEPLGVARCLVVRAQLQVVLVRTDAVPDCVCTSLSYDPHTDEFKRRTSISNNLCTPGLEREVLWKLSRTYRGISLIRNRAPLGPYSRPMPRAGAVRTRLRRCSTRLGGWV